MKGVLTGVVIRREKRRQDNLLFLKKSGISEQKTFNFPDSLEALVPRIEMHEFDQRCRVYE